MVAAIARRKDHLDQLVGEIDNNRQQGNLSSAIRLFVLDYFKSRAVAMQDSKAQS